MRKYRSVSQKTNISQIKLTFKKKKKKRVNIRVNRRFYIVLVFES